MKKFNSQILSISVLASNIFKIFIGLGFLLLLILSSCEKALEIDNPKSKIINEVVFEDDITASAAVTGVYASMLASGSFASGSNNSITAITALSSDEFVNYPISNTTAIQFNQNKIQSNNIQIYQLWSSAFQIIYQTNSIIEGIEKSDGMSANAQQQLKGEALFVRAFCNFNLVNLFGDIPLISTTDYSVNTRSPRTSKDVLYGEIIKDLLQAQQLMKDAYPTPERVRPNKSAATALLSRVYLYRNDWANAEIQSTSLINNPDYELEMDLNNVFLYSSREAIWQLRPILRTQNTFEGNAFILRGIPGNSYLRKDFIDKFETGDARFTNWVRSITASSNVFYYPFKYKIRTGGPGSATPIPLTEYSMVFRLAEQYLIRSEARAKLGKLNEAIADIDVIRGRANLPLIKNINPGISQALLLVAVEQERRSELFIEWGHRWFDLKRTGRLSVILSPLKPDWQPSDVLYPIPSSEFIR